MPSEEIVDHLGHIRKMGLNEVSSEDLMMRASRQSFQAYLESIGGGLIARDKWKPVNRRKELDTKFVLDQKSSSGCTGYSAAHLLMRLRAMRGMTYQKLSGSFIYAQINGGRDNGSVIVHASQTLEDVGTCLSSEFDFPKIYNKDVPASARETASRFRLLNFLTCDTFEEAATAIQMGFLPQFPIQIGSNFEKFEHGIAGVAKGYGNHSVGADGMDYINGKWVLDMPNTWGPNWGPFKNGRAYIAEAAFAGLGGTDDSYILIDAQYDPQDPNLPPTPVE